VTAQDPKPSQETTRGADPHEERAGNATVHSSPQAHAVRIVGRGDGVVVQINEVQASWEQILEMLAAHLNQAAGFFRGERITLELGDLVVNRQQLRQILELLAEQEMSVRLVRTSSAEVHQTAHEFGLAVERQAPDESRKSRTAKSFYGDNWEVVLGGKEDAAVQVNQEFQMPAAITDALVDAIHADALEQAGNHLQVTDADQEEATLIAPAVQSSVIVHPTEPDLVQRISAPPYLYRGTLRSGQVFRHAGPVIVVGDVNPGAQIVSAGDVYVWGRLRGIIHAGAMGDETVQIGAVDFEPIQVRIASYIAISPRAEARDPGRWFWRRRSTGRPEIARVINGQIVVDQWDARWTLQ
jgi:septum site-determining protein MinC